MPDPVIPGGDTTTAEMARRARRWGYNDSNGTQRKDTVGILAQDVLALVAALSQTERERDEALQDAEIEAGIADEFRAEIVNYCIRLADAEKALRNLLGKVAVAADALHIWPEIGAAVSVLVSRPSAEEEPDE